VALWPLRHHDITKGETIMKFTKKAVAALGSMLAAGAMLALSGGVAQVAQAKPVPDSLKQEACQVMDALGGSGDELVNGTAAILMATHKGMDEGTAAWAIIHGVQDQCDWHKDDMPVWCRAR